MAHPLNDKTPKLKKRRWPLVATLLACCLLLVWMVAPMLPPSLNAFFTDTTTISLDKRRSNDSRVIAMPLAMGGRSNARSTNDGGVGNGRKSVFIEVCGQGIQQIEDDSDNNGAFSEFAEKFIPDPVPTLTNAASQMIARADDNERAVGLYMMAFLAGVPQQKERTKENPDCESTKVCREKYDEIARNAAAPHLDALAKLAATTDDPNVYASAYYACRSKKQGMCSSVTATRWSTLDPENAAAWLEVAGEASSQKNEAASNAAIVKASQLKQYDTRAPALEMLLGEIDFSAIGLLDQSSVLSQLVATKLVFPPYITTLQYCRAVLADSPDRREVCGSIAKLITDHDQSLLGQTIALSLGEKAGWAADLVKAKKDEIQAYVYLPSIKMSPEDRFSCAGAQQQIPIFLDIFKFGELEAAKKRMRANGLTIRTMVEQFLAQSRDKK